MEGIILCGQPGRSFEVGKATGFLAPAGLFLASKFAANSVVQDISKSFMFLAFPLAHHNFFPTFVLKVPGLLPCPHPHQVCGVALPCESQTFSGIFRTGFKGSNGLLQSQVLTNVLSLPVLSLHTPTFPAG